VRKSGLSLMKSSQQITSSRQKIHAERWIESLKHMICLLFFHVLINKFYQTEQFMLKRKN
jgi:hypothetical protein